MEVTTMHQHSSPTVRTVYVAPCVAGIHLDYSIGEELPLFGPPLDKPLTYGIGYNSGSRRKAMGMPYFKTGKGTPHKTWSNMMRRNYSSDAKAYQSGRVCMKWHDYQEFAAWYVSQPYAGMPDAELDKDIIDPLNTVYSPEYCCVVPKLVNQIFKDSRKRRGKLPVGVREHPSKVGFLASISMHGKQCGLGRFDCIFEAFDAYKQAREKYGQELAQLYDGLINPRAVDALRRLSAHIRG